MASVRGILTNNNDAVEITTTDMASVSLAVTGTWTGSLIPEISVDGLTWLPTSVFVVGTGVPVVVITDDNIWNANVSGYLSFRIRANSISGGTANIVLTSSAADAVVANSNLGLATFTPGTPNIVVPVGAYDYTNNDVKYLQVSDNSNGLLVEVTTPVALYPGSLVNTQYQAYSNGGSTLLKTQTTLPAAGAFTTVPVQGADGTILVPQVAKKIIVYINYNRGGVGGQAAHKFYGYNGSEQGQLMSLDGTYNQINGAPSTGAFPIVYIMSFDVTALLYFGIISAEIGNTGSPGTCGATITFG